MHIDSKRAHENASLLVRQLPCLKRGKYSSYLDICLQIEKHQKEMLAKGRALHVYKQCKILVSSNKKIYLLIEHEGLKLGSGTSKTIYKGLDYFKGKIVAYYTFSLNQLIMKEKERKKYSEEELLVRYEDLSENLESELCVIEFLNQNVPRGIVKLIDYYKNQNEILGIFKYYQCGELKNFLITQKTGKLSTTPSRPQKVKMAYELIAGLAGIHQTEIAHDDIKSENILVGVKRLNAKRKQILTVISDFNLYTEKNGGDDGDANCFFYTIGGTPWYYSPEKIEAMVSKEFRAYLSFEQAMKSDVWALGCVLYNLFIETPPWFEKMEEIGHVFYSEKHRTSTIVKDALNRAFPEPENKNSIEHLIWRMLRPDYNARISSKDALAVIKEFLPKPIIPRLKLPNAYPSSESVGTPDSEDASESSRGSVKETPKDTPKGFTPKTSRIRIRSHSFHHLNSARVETQLAPLNHA